MNSSPFLIAVFSTAALGLAAHGSVLFDDDFESYTADTNIGTSVWTQSTGVGSYMTARDESTDTPFGTPNQYAELADTGGGNGQFVRLMSPVLGDTADALTTLRFDFHEPAGGGDSVIRFGYAGDDGNRYDLNSGGGRLVATFNNGTIGGVSGGTSNSYSVGTAYTMYMIFNDTGSPVNYLGGTIGASSGHLWYEELGSGAFVFAGSASASNAQDTGGYAVGFRTFNAELQTLLIDNVTVSEGAAAVPEPAIATLSALGLLALVRRRR